MCITQPPQTCHPAFRLTSRCLFRLPSPSRAPWATCHWMSATRIAVSCRSSSKRLQPSRLPKNNTAKNFSHRKTLNPMICGMSVRVLHHSRQSPPLRRTKWMVLFFLLASRPRLAFLGGSPPFPSATHLQHRHYCYRSSP